MMQNRILRKFLLFVAICSFLFFPSVFLFSEPSFSLETSDLKTHVREITSILPHRNHENPKSLDIAAEYISKNLKKSGYSPKEQKFTVNQIEYRNIEARVGIGNGRKIVIGAHYDVAGDQPGADDNASGIAALLEIARALKQNEKSIRYEIILVAFSLEEPPYFRTESMGSYIHAKSLKDKNEDIELMIALETVGYFSEKKDSQEYPISIMKKFYPTQGNFIAGIGGKGEFGYLSRLKETYLHDVGLSCEILVAPRSLKGVDFSDHLNYWNFGYKAILITDTAFYRNKNYHETSDKSETLDYVKLREVVKGILLFILNNRI